MSRSRKMVVSSALPYANGHLHLGHCVEHVQTDIWVRVHKMLHIDCISICGEDTHGTPIMLKAEKQNITPEALIASMKESHEADFNAFRVDYDMYYTTHSPENQAFSEAIYQALEARGDIVTQTITQAYDPVKQMFLPDRYVKGTCPRCKATDQYGDNCEVCGATYVPTELIDPISVVSGAKPISKESEHYFFDLPKYEKILKEWVHKGHLQDEVVNKLDEWFQSGLKLWDISRDAPYFGFLIPGKKDKYFYVWLDAPIGYMASFKKYADKNNLSFDEYWAKDATTELYHFVGKDIVYFHALFWPAVLFGADFRMPSAVFAHGFLTVQGQKMSKSRGTFIEARTYLKHLDPEYLRYYFAAKLTAKVEDLDLNFDDFFNRVNADLVGKVVNIASRSASFIAKYFENKLATTLAEPTLYQELLGAREAIIETYIARDYAKAIRMIMDCADKANQYIDKEKPWVLARSEEHLTQVQSICTMGLNLFMLLMTYLKPVLPTMAEKAEHFLQIPPLAWDSVDKPLLSHTIGPFEPLMLRVDKAKIEAVLNESKA